MMQRICFVLLFGLLLGMSAYQLYGATESELTGWVSDTGCGVDHTKAGGKDCVEKCVRGGADIGHPEWKPQARVFVEDKEKKIWSVKNQDALKGYEGEHVRIQAKQESEKEGLEIVKVTRIDEDK